MGEIQCAMNRNPGKDLTYLGGGDGTPLDEANVYSHRKHMIRS